MSAPPLDLDALDAIDVHVHVHSSVHGGGAEEEGVKEMAKYFKTEATAFTVPQIAEYYRERRMACVVFGVDSMAEAGREMHPSNEEVAELAAKNADVIIPFASIDPTRGKAGVLAARRLIEEYGVRGFKFHPNAQAFYPNDRSCYPLYEVLAEHGVIALFHSGHAGVGAGTRGGGGIRLKYSNPMYVDDVAVDFPDLPIILAHPAFPWQDEQLSVAMHKTQVYIDLSGWSPKYFQPQLIQHANTILRHRMLFGSDFPMIMPERWLADFEKAAFRDEVRPLILKENAARLFGLTSDPESGR
jgi:predicted TIM-barrel fold metal-dependent hydrolase